MPLWRWSQTSASNASADPTVAYNEGQTPGSLNDSARAAMAAVAMYRDDIAGALVSSGSSTAYTIASYSVYDSLAHLNGAMIAFTPHTSNGATVTLNVDSLGAKPLRSSPNVELPSGSLIQGTPYVVTYNNSDGAFYLQGGASNPYSCPLGGMMLYTGNTSPNSAFVLPFGQAISRTTYSTYFSLVGTGYGVGDGSTTFNVVDLRGRVPAGPDDMGGSAAGRLAGLAEGTALGASTHTLTTAELPASPLSVTGTTSGYTPNISGAGIIGLPGGATPEAETQTGAANTYPSSAYGAVAGFASLTVTATTANMGSGGAHSIVQPTVGVNYILRIV